MSVATGPGVGLEDIARSDFWFALIAGSQRKLGKTLRLHLMHLFSVFNSVGAKTHMLPQLGQS
jgi:hypothetical protein